MTVLKKTICCLILLIVSSCKKETQEFTDTPIIEAYIHPGGFFSVTITRQIPFSSGVEYSADNINALLVNLKLNNENHTLTSFGNGVYGDSLLTVDEGNRLDLSFSFNKKDVSAYTTIPTKPVNFTQSATTYTITRQDTSRTNMGPGSFTFPDPVKFSWTNTDNSYYLLVIENMETTLDPIRSFGGNAPPGNRFKKTPTTGSSNEIRALEFQYYGKHRVVLYHVLPDYAKLYESTSTSSQNLTNPSTSIVNGYGIFTGLNADTLYLEVKEP